MHLRPRPLALAALLACALAPSGARAGSPFYGAARAGAFVPTVLEGFGTGLDVELAGGWWVLPNLALELSLGRGSVAGEAGYEEPPGSPVYTRLTLFPLAATARWNFWWGSFRPYLLAGGGVVVVRNRPEIPIPGRGPLSSAWTEAALSLTAGAGIVYQADEKFAFGVEGRYGWGRLDHGGEVALDGAMVAATMEMRL
jgi:opacity protein-like surface antigen